MSLFDAFSMFVGHIVLWGFGIFAGLFLGYFLLSVSIGVMAWIFNRFFEGESYIWKLISKVLKKEQA